MRTAIGIDLGGTNMRAALLSAGGKILASERRKTPLAQGPAECARQMGEMAATLAAHPQAGDVQGVGIGSPGPLSRSQRMLFKTPNLPGFDNFPLGLEVERVCGLPTKLDNDAKCAALGEGRFGAARGCNDYVLLTFGTGIGGGVVSAGQMLYGKSDGAAELGHITLYPGGEQCGCGNRGCFEMYCSAINIGRRATQAQGRPLECHEVFEAQARGEAWAAALLRDVSKDMAIALATLVNIFEPEMIVMGGGAFSGGGGPLCEWIVHDMREQRRCFASSLQGLRVLPSQLHGDAGVVGAASLIL